MKTKPNKLLSLILVFVMLFGLVPPSAHAEGGSPALTVDTVEVVPGRTADVKISLSAGTNTAMMQFALRYDETKLILASDPELNETYARNGIINAATAPGYIYYNWEGDAPLTDAGVLFTLRFSLKDITSGSIPVTVDKTKEFIFCDSDFSDIPITVVDGAVNVSALEGKIRIDSVEAAAGGNAGVKVSLSANTDVAMMQFALRYDETKLTVKNASLADPDNGLINTEIPGQIIYVWESDTPISEEAVLFTVSFAAIAPAPDTAEIGLDNEFSNIFCDALFNNIDVTVIPGTVSIVEKPVAVDPEAINPDYIYLELNPAGNEIPADGATQREITVYRVENGVKTRVDNTEVVFTANPANLITLENGVITAGTKTGSVTVSARYGSSLASVELSLLPKTNHYWLTVPNPDNPDEYLPENQPLILEKSSSDRVYILSLFDADQPEDERWDYSITNIYKFASTNAKVAKAAKITNKSNPNYGFYAITIPKNALGACTVTATPVNTALKDAVLTLSVYVQDYTPRLEAATGTMNTNLAKDLTLQLIPSYGKEIERVELHEALGTSYAPTATDKLEVLYENGTLVLNNTEKGIANGKSAKFQLWCYAPGEDEAFDKSLTLTVKRKDAFPAVTVKQTDKLNLFFKDSETHLSFTAKGAVIQSVDFDETACSYEKVSYKNGELTVSATDYRVSSKPVNGKVNILFAGYDKPLNKALSISTVTTPPAFKLSATAGTIYTGAGSHNLQVSVLNSDGSPADLTGCTVSVSGSGAVLEGQNGNVITLKVTSLGKSTAVIKIENDNWTAAAKTMNYAINVVDTLPTVKLASAALTLNINYDLSAETDVILSSGNVNITGSFTPTGSNITNGVTLKYENGKIIAAVKDGQKLEPNKTYSFNFMPSMDGTALKAVPFKLVVTNKAATVKTAASGKLDAVLKEQSSTVYAVTLSGINGEIVDVSAATLKAAATGTSIDGKDMFDVSLGEPNAKGLPTAVVKLKDGVEYDITKTYKLRLKFTVECQNGTAEILMPSDLSFKVTQSALKAAAVKTAQTVYQSQSAEKTVTYRVNVSTPAGAKIDSASVGKLDAAFRKILAQGAANISFEINPDGQSLTVHVRINDTSKLVAGKTYSLPIVITPEGAVNAKADATVKLSLKALA